MVRRPARVGCSASPVRTGLSAPTRTPRSRSDAASAALRTVLPTPCVSASDEEAAHPLRRLGRRATPSPAKPERPGSVRKHACCAAELMLSVRGHHRQPQPRCHRRHRGRPDGLREHALAQRSLATAHRELGLSEHQRHDLGARAAAGQSPPRSSSSRSTAAFRASRSTISGCSSTIESAAIAAATADGGSAVEKMNVRAALTRYSAIVLFARDERAVGAQAPCRACRR